jgi:hypothetical protein
MEYLGFTESQRFLKNATRLFGEDGIAELEQYLSLQPERGEVIRGSGGIRKLRWSSSGRGKRGGSRIIYFFADVYGRIYLLDAYAKNEKEDLSANKIKDLSRLVRDWLRSYER